MARQLRIEYEGGFYHITSRGNQREKIFWGAKDRERLKTILERTKERYGYLLHAYVFMSNHYHLLIETPHANLHQVMQNINTSYTVFVNKKYHRSGHLFQGRYKAFIVDKDKYLLALSRYIHLNPVRAGVVKRAEQFRWSSYQEYLHGRKGGTLADTDETLGFFSKQRAVAVRKYKEFVEAGIQGKSPLPGAMGSILGDEGFREGVLKFLRVTSDKAGIPEIRKIERTHEIKDIVKGVAGYYGLMESDLLRRRKSTERQRKIGVYLSKLLSSNRNADIGAVFGITIQAVTNAVRDVEKRREGDKRFDLELKKIKESIGAQRQSV
jgi:REP element-mobilizing transposase RayT